MPGHGPVERAGPRKPAAAHCRPEAAGGRRAGRRRRRGTRAGHRVQRRRSRAGCDLDRAVRGGSAGPRDRCLVSPARLTLRQTARWEPSRPERGREAYAQYRPLKCALDRA